MHIAFFNRSYYPDQGATGQLLTELAESLVRDYGCRVSVVAGRPLLPSRESRSGARWWRPVQWEHHNGVEIIRTGGTTFRPRTFAGRAANYVTYFLSACVAGLMISRPDIVVSLTDPPVIGLAALMTAGRAHAKFVFLCQDIFPEVAVLLEDFQSPTVNRLLERINRLLIRNADRVIVLGETMKARLITKKGADPGKVRVIHNWADCSAITPGDKQNPWSRATKLADRFVVMHSGNMGLSQNLDALLEAAGRLHSYTDIVMAMVGDGAKRKALEACARSQGLTNVRFLPYQPKARLTESFATADVFIISLKEGLAGCIVPSKALQHPGGRSAVRPLWKRRVRSRRLPESTSAACWPGRATPTI
ncbi:MAG: glycosyltransferase family 4 protein [Candidatus Methylomirabilis sp.]|nr:glycosyltransferase family 4 protein [Candidatus Methylomirabilis sp.]